MQPNKHPNLKGARIYVKTINLAKKYIIGTIYFIYNES
jgi:hypothetical protein